MSPGAKSNKVWQVGKKDGADNKTADDDLEKATVLSVMETPKENVRTLGNGGSNGASNASSNRSTMAMDKPKPALFTAPLMVFLSLAENIPLLITLILVWKFSSFDGEVHIDEFVTHGRHVADTIIESKMDSIMDSALLKMKSVYEHALSTAKSGATVETQIVDEPYFEQVKMMSFWSQSVAGPFHYEMVHQTRACNGHIIGTGYDYEKKEYLAWYTDFEYAQKHVNGAPFPSANGVTYDAEGCNTVDLVGTSTQEKTYRTTYTDKDGWLPIETDGFSAHGPLTLLDGRADPNYQAAVTSENGCAWSKVFVGLEEPHHLSKTVANVYYDDDSNVLGTVSATILLDEVVTMIEEISRTLNTLSVIVVNGDGNKVIAASEGNNSHVTVGCMGDMEVELYSLEEYADIVKTESGNRYNDLRTYIADHPEFIDGMNSHMADISDEDTHHYHATHGIFITPQGIHMLLSGIQVIDTCGLSYTIYIILEEEEMIAQLLEENEKAHVENLETTRNTFIAVFTALFFISLGGVGLARAISTPLQVIRKDINLVSQLDFDGELMRFRPFVTDLKNMIDQYMKLKVTLCDFNCFVPPHLLEELVEFGDEAIQRTAAPKEIATLFVYVTNFSAASHNSEAHIIADFANQFIGGAADIVSNMSGTVIDFFGESLFGIFNAPYDDPDYIKNSMECAHEIMALFQRVKAEFMSVHPDFSLIDVRIGLHCGSALVGKIGSQSRLKYCAVGDTVNVGARIENMNRRYESNMVCSSDFLEALGENRSVYCSRPMEYVKVQGRSDPILLYEIGGMINSVENAKLTEFKEHTDIFFRVRKGEAGDEETEAHIAKYGGTSSFLRAASIDISALQEIKKFE